LIEPDATTPVRHMTVRVPVSGDETVALRFNQRGEAIDVGVRSSDGTAAEALRRNLPELVQSLERSGFEPEVTRSISPPPAADEVVRVEFLRSGEPRPAADAAAGDRPGPLASGQAADDDNPGERRPQQDADADEWHRQRGRRHKQEYEADTNE
jgi:hypothetical protein